MMLFYGVGRVASWPENWVRARKLPSPPRKNLKATWHKPGKPGLFTAKTITLLPTSLPATLRVVAGAYFKVRTDYIISYTGTKKSPNALTIDCYQLFPGRVLV